MSERIVWEFPDSYRDGLARIGDYMLIFKGGRPHEFDWMVSYKGDVIVDSGNDPCRSTQECRRITEAIYKLHSAHIKTDTMKDVIVAASVKDIIEFAENYKNKQQLPKPK